MSQQPVASPYQPFASPSQAQLQLQQQLQQQGYQNVQQQNPVQQPVAGVQGQRQPSVYDGMINPQQPQQIPGQPGYPIGQQAPQWVQGQLQNYQGQLPPQQMPQPAYPAHQLASGLQPQPLHPQLQQGRVNNRVRPQPQQQQAQQRLRPDGATAQNRPVSHERIPPHMAVDNSAQGGRHQVGRKPGPGYTHDFGSNTPPRKTGPQIGPQKHIPDAPNTATDKVDDHGGDNGSDLEQTGDHDRTQAVGEGDNDRAGEDRNNNPSKPTNQVNNGDGVKNNQPQVKPHVIPNTKPESPPRRPSIMDNSAQDVNRRPGANRPNDYNGYDMKDNTDGYDPDRRYWNAPAQKYPNRWNKNSGNKGSPFYGNYPNNLYNSDYDRYQYGGDGSNLFDNYERAPSYNYYNMDSGTYI